MVVFSTYEHFSLPSNLNYQFQSVGHKTSLASVKYSPHKKLSIFLSVLPVKQPLAG